GQGQRYVGSIVVTTDGDGNGYYIVTVPGSVAEGTVLSATATDRQGDTSEFSMAVPVHTGTPQPSGGGQRNVTPPIPRSSGLARAGVESSPAAPALGLTAVPAEERVTAGSPAPDFRSDQLSRSDHSQWFDAGVAPGGSASVASLATARPLAASDLADVLFA